MDATEQREPVAVLADPVQAPEAPRLVFQGSRGATSSFDLGGRAEAIIGRGASCDLVLADPRASRRHALVMLVGRPHLLRDLGSSNGTFLNGFRLPPGNAFSLRDGDAIEIGDARLAYIVGRAEPADSAASEVNCSSYSPADLVRDGYFALELGERIELQASVQGAFEGVARPAGLERSMAIVARLLEVDLAAFFAVGSKGDLRPVAAVPRQDVADRVVELASRAWASREAKLVTQRVIVGNPGNMETCIGSELSAAAVPIVRGKCRAVVAVERAGKRLDRSDVALLAVLATNTLLTLALEGGEPGDTRVGLFD